MEQMTTAVQRTFSHDKYDAMEANIHYVDINEKGNSTPNLKKRKNYHNNQGMLLLTIVLLSMIIIGFMCNLFTTENNSPPQPRSLYQNYNIDEMTPEYAQETSSGSVEGFKSYNPISIEELYNDTIEEVDNYTNGKYKCKYHKLIEVCVPRLRRGLKLN